MSMAGSVQRVPAPLAEQALEHVARIADVEGYATNWTPALPVPASGTDTGGGAGLPRGRPRQMHLRRDIAARGCGRCGA